MGRAHIDPSLRKINVQLAPPADLTPAQRKLWDEEFSRFPPGYFVPADMRGLLLYLETLQRHRSMQRMVDTAEKSGTLDIKLHRIALEYAKQVHRLQKDLRMYPSTRTHREIHGTMANSPTGQSAGAQQGEGWRALVPVKGKAK